MTRAYTNMDAFALGLAEDLSTMRHLLSPQDGSEAATALGNVETFCAVALRVLRKTNPSKVRSEARTFEIKMRLDGLGEQ